MVKTVFPADLFIVRPSDKVIRFLMSSDQYLRSVPMAAVQEVRKLFALSSLFIYPTDAQLD